MALGLRQIIDDMRSKNHAYRIRFESAGEKEVRVSAPFVSKVGPLKFEL